MKHLFKPFLFLALALSFTYISCGSDDGSGDEDFKGIKIATTRSSGESEGVGMACNFGKILKEQLSDSELDELFEELDDEDEFDKGDFDKFIDKIFGDLKTMYVIVAGDDVDFENKGGFGVEGEAFSLFWYSDDEEPTTGTFEAEGIKFNVTDTEDLKEGAEVFAGKITVNLTEITDDLMVGTFNGTVENKEGVSEDLSGEFNVERNSCED